MNYSNLFESRPLLVHRLDKDTSGILIFALNRKYAKHFSDLFRDRKIEKTYEAIVIGEPDQNEGLITNDIQEDENTYKAETKFNDLTGELINVEADLPNHFFNYI